MDELLAWATEKWPQLLAALSIGGGSGFLTKKYKDKKQDKQIGLLDNRIGELEGFKLEQIKNLHDVKMLAMRVKDDMKLNRLEDLNTKDTVMYLVKTVEKNKQDMDANFKDITKLITAGQLELTKLILNSK